MATYYLPSSTSGYDTSNTYVKYRIRIVEGTFNSSNRTIPITVQAYFYRTNTGYTTDYTHTLKYTINGTAYSYSNAYGSYPITNSGIYLNSRTVNVPVNDDGSVNVSVYCQYTSTNSDKMTTGNNGGSISLTKQAAKTYTVSYNANGGSGAPSNDIKYHGTNLKLSSTIPTKSGYRFLGWATSPTATTASYEAGGNYITNSPVTLYAVWTQSTLIQTIMARYQLPTGGFTSYSQVYAASLNQGATCSWSSPETDEYKAASISYTVGTTAEIKYITIYRKQYTISYNANGGLFAPKTQSFYYGCDLRLSDKRPTRSGYDFLGWGNASNATSPKYLIEDWFDSTNTSNPTLYAVWSKCKTNIYLYSTGLSEAGEYVESDSLYFDTNGAIYTKTFTENTLNNSAFSIGLEFIASEISEIHTDEN